ncbi:DUF421 domain-containing protein [Pontibacillus yanchengensis]|uniref:YetF C-terminal domain-containing protein n=1 Tax=Pontibacillus yanchengensis Y32 TaxID=1385514 RepID=A0A0A2TEA6_9BACI|nr:DUF421 domain-containing protein [Pontibacillus yanchengensis]KGP73839.1 hypothetical protein N782_20965 [Pontibacillus yanchengensis Y32]
MSVIEVLVRILLTFIVLLILTRVMGRKQISQLTFFNYVTGISIGTIGGSLTIDENLEMVTGYTALIGWSALTVIAGLISINSKSVRDIMDGQPVVVIKQGKIMDDALKRLRMDLDEVVLLLRNKDVFSIQDVDYAIMETNGKLSVLKKEGKLPASRTDVNAASTPPQFPLPTSIIMGGNILGKNLRDLGLSEEWLSAQLQQLGIKTPEKVFYAELQKDGSIYIDEYNDEEKKRLF